MAGSNKWKANNNDLGERLPTFQTSQVVHGPLIGNCWSRAHRDPTLCEVICESRRAYFLSWGCVWGSVFNFRGGISKDLTRAFQTQGLPDQTMLQKWCNTSQQAKGWPQDSYMSSLTRRPTSELFHSPAQQWENCFCRRSQSKYVGHLVFVATSPFCGCSMNAAPLTPTVSNKTLLTKAVANPLPNKMYLWLIDCFY